MSTRALMSCVVVLCFNATVHADDSPPSFAQHLFAPNHQPSVSIDIAGGVAPTHFAGNIWISSLDLVFNDVSVGFSGSYLSCQECDGNPEDSPVGLFRSHISYSLDNGAIGGTVVFARGSDLNDETRLVSAAGAGVRVRLGRVDGVRFVFTLEALSAVRDGFVSFGTRMELRVPMFANRFARIWIEGAIETTIPSPSLILMTAGIRARLGPVVLGLHTLDLSALLVSIGVRRNLAL